MIGGGLAACAFALRSKPRTPAALAALAFVCLWAVSAPAASRWLAAGLEHGLAPLDPLRAGRADAIAVLGGGTGPATAPRRHADLNDASDRVVEAARLHRAGLAPLVVVIGGRPPSDLADGSEAADMAELLELLGVPAASIVLERESTNTRENCTHLSEIARERGFRRVLLVTSALHVRRAVSLCVASGVPGVVAAPTDFESVREGANGILAWLPDARALARSSAALREHLALLAQSELRDSRAK